ncbi:hypothetical protein ABB37_01467 [Leptomonas pyrrhocoris]|uniref:Uncharacterized protein n=1 Tax=Leptomonas pyrrhocoris TaxID=157538 RepID=A0A0M9G919_LEPPY|nr:hypothetical protein ABB37_01467 [Leptomonas pyrrhocoris]XP_015663486.1 hypothetical protein ABB37_01467 [Leptomonas pyrrhocoris]KPA85046.1 hypothetical protein ABB37_01467 [Leptomonas pyrrhocoris]KPA85047.1 hypothetical protein ABB37_01467 [Leptomonas pyrrhocoris]|eukprot:XP_015663485.1 hypothetical protein ABB37_01467 [Leptomonas pyrrhocoris]
MSEIDDLVSRLRSITGYTAAAPTPPSKPAAVSVEKQLSSDSLLFLQQSLRRHPCFGVFGLSRAEVDCQLLKELDDAASTPVATASEASVAVMWRLFINEAADALEAERLSGVFQDPTPRLDRAKDDLFARLGVQTAPLLSQVGDGYPCPWNVLATLENSLLFDQDDFREFPKAHLHVPNATTSILLQLQKVYDDSYNTLAWLQLLHQLMRFPVASVRVVWQAALYHFPTAAPLVCVYTRLELAAVAKTSRLDACRGETDAEDVYRDYLRVLNTFYRHLPLTFSCELYSLFFAFATEYIQPDNTSLDLLFRTCLRRDVGMLPQSTKLWRNYLSWRSATIRDHTRRRIWRKRMFQRILAIPLINLDEVKAEYDIFVDTEYRGRVAPDEKAEVESRLKRVKAEADDLSRLMYFFYPTEWEPASQTIVFPHTLYLARPLTVDGPLNPNNIKDAVLSRIEMDLWTSWYTLLQSIRRPLFPGAGGDILHYGRCRSFMTMAAGYFPHQPTLWMELIDFCVHQQPILSDKERFGSVAAAIELATTFHRHDLCVRLYVAQAYVTDFSAIELAFRDMKEGLLYLRGWLLHYVKEDAVTATKEDVLETLQHVTVLAVNFMRMGNTQGEEQHIHLVARFVMHQVEFLVLTMAVLRKLFKASAIAFPAPFLRPFYTFCAQWISLELIRSRAPHGALRVLQQWCEHLKIMLQSGKAKGWTCEECGLDELLLDTCSNLLTADPSTRSTIDAMLAQLEEVVNSGGIRPGNFTYLARQLRHHFFLPCPPPPPGDVRDVLLMSKLLLPHAAPHRYDTVQFRCPPPQISPLSSTAVLTQEKEANADETTLPPPQTPAAAAHEDSADTRTTEVIEREKDAPVRASTMPEESLWSSAISFRNSATPGRPRFDRPRRGPFPGTTADSSEGPPRELPRVPAIGPSRLAVLSESLQLPTLLDCLGSGRHTDADRGKAATKLPPLDQLEDFITELPSVYEYNPDVEEGGKDVSTEWVLRTLLSCEALC